MSDQDARFWFGGLCGSAVATLILVVAFAVSQRDWHALVMDQTKVDAYRVKVQAESVLGGGR